MRFISSCINQDCLLENRVNSQLWQQTKITKRKWLKKERGTSYVTFTPIRVDKPYKFAHSLLPQRLRCQSVSQAASQAARQPATKAIVVDIHKTHWNQLQVGLSVFSVILSDSTHKLDCQKGYYWMVILKTKWMRAQTWNGFSVQRGLGSSHLPQGLFPRGQLDISRRLEKYFKDSNSPYTPGYWSISRHKSTCNSASLTDQC